MRILVVEDEAASRAEIERALDTLELELERVFATCRSEALDALDTGEYDFVICNLHIPPEPGGDPALEHGLAVYEHVTDTRPGTPTVLLTGSGDERLARERVAARPATDIFGVGEPYPMTDLVYKHETSTYVERVAEVASQLAALADIEIQPDAQDITLQDGQTRALRIFARRHGARRVEFRALGGMSAALAVQATLFTEHREYIAAAFAKLAPLEDIAAESRAYHEAAVRLPAGSYAPLLDTVDAGADGAGGLFYGLAERHPDTLFGRILEHPEEAASAVADLQEVLGAWHDPNAEPEEVLITTLRRERVSSGVIEPFAQALGEHWQDFEKQSIAIMRTLQHGDLHGANVLAGQSALPLIIDFANVAPYPAGFDPLVLELSLVFHPLSPFSQLTWPAIEQCEQWDDLDVYLDGCLAAGAVRTCREWARQEAGQPAALYALAYAEALRQLQFAASETDRALAIARAACRAGLEALAEHP